MSDTLIPAEDDGSVPWRFTTLKERSILPEDQEFMRHLRGLHELMTQAQACAATSKLVALAAESKAGETRACNGSLSSPEWDHLGRIDDKIRRLCQDLGLTMEWGDPRGFILHITNIPGNQAFTRAYGLR